MQGYNHVAGGLVFTGIFASFHDVNVFSQPSLLAGTVFCALLPDTDHTRSGIGKLAYPLASFLQSRYGHRTLTHSLFFYLGCVGLFCLLPHHYTLCFSYALLSHLLFDMCTHQGVPLLYPFSKRPFVLPANPGLRLSAQDHRSEAIVFVVFLAVGSFCQPLFARGFWTSYNEAFATWEHVVREGKRPGLTDVHELLLVSWLDTRKQARTGYFYRAEGTSMIVLTPMGFEQPRSTETTLISFRHTGITAVEHQHTLTNVTLDSLNQLLTGHCLRVQIQSLDDLTYFDGPILKSGKLIDLEHCKNLLIHTPRPDESTIRSQLDLLHLERDDQHRHYARELALYNRTLQATEQLQLRRQALDREFSAASDFRKGQIIDERRSLTTKLESALAHEPLPPLAPDDRRFAVQEQLLRNQLRRDNRISASLFQLTTSQPLR